MRAWAGFAVAMAAAAATLAPTTAGGEDDGRARLPAHTRMHPHAEYAEYAQPLPEPRQDPWERPRPRGGAATIRYSEPVVPVLPLGAGLTCLGVGIAIIGLRIRNG